jgi:hypothetical protein
MAKKRQNSSDDDTDDAQKPKQDRSRTASVVMGMAVASAFVSVGAWIAHDFYNINVPAHLTPALATLFLWLANVGRAIAVALFALLEAIFLRPG